MSLSSLVEIEKSKYWPKEVLNSLKCLKKADESSDLPINLTYGETQSDYQVAMCLQLGVAAVYAFNILSIIYII